jgi:hypothetical protein
MNSNFSFIQIRNNGENPIHISKERLEFIKKFMKTEYYYVDPESHDFVISRNINSEPHSRPPIIKEYDILITHDINVYQNTRPQNLDDIVAKYLDLWTDIGRTIDVPEDIWMHMRLKENADAEDAKLLYKFYKISFNERVIIDTALDKLHN